MRAIVLIAEDRAAHLYLGYSGLLRAVGKCAGSSAADDFYAVSGPAGEDRQNMRQRLATLGGHCLVESRLGHGTTIQFVLSFNGSV